MSIKNLIFNELKSFFTFLFVMYSNYLTVIGKKRMYNMTDLYKRGGIVSIYSNGKLAVYT